MKLLILLLLVVSCNPIEKQFLGAPISYREGRSGDCTVNFLIHIPESNQRSSQLTRTEMFRGNPRACSFFKSGVLPKNYGKFYHVIIKDYLMESDVELTPVKIKNG